MSKVKFKIKILKKICAATLSLALVVVGLFPVNIVTAKSQIIPNDETGIPDKYLYQEILYELDKKSDGKFTKEEAARVYRLDINYAGKKKVKTLKGIENLVNLLSLEIHDNSLTSLKGVEGLVNLQTLKIGKGNLKNLNEVKDLPKLKELSVEGNKIEDWTVVSDLTNLENLRISDCGLTGSGLEKVVSKLTGLTSLEVSKSCLEDLKSISGLTKLETLNVSNNKLKSLSGLETLTELHSLYISNNKLTKLTGIENLTGLLNVYANNNNLANVKEVENLIRLEILDVSKNEIAKLPSLKKHINLNLEYSSFFYNKISEKEFKKNLPSHVPTWWINNQVLLQNLEKKLKINSVKKIKSVTKKITGVTEKKATVVLMKSNGKKIKTVKANKKGAFSFKNLDLKKYKGKKLKVTAYLLYDDRINGERHKQAIGTVRFSVRKK